MQPTLNGFAKVTAKSRTAIRTAIISAIKADRVPAIAVHKLDDVNIHLPMQIGDYTDYLCGREHSNNCAKVFNVPSALPQPL